MLGKLLGVVVSLLAARSAALGHICRARVSHAQTSPLQSIPRMLQARDRTHGMPPICAGSTLIRSKFHIDLMVSTGKHGNRYRVADLNLSQHVAARVLIDLGLVYVEGKGDTGLLCLTPDGYALLSTAESIPISDSA